jgi:hypothetical protein
MANDEEKLKSSKGRRKVLSQEMKNLMMSRS